MKTVIVNSHGYKRVEDFIQRNTDCVDFTLNEVVYTNRLCYIDDYEECVIDLVDLVDIAEDYINIWISNLSDIIEDLSIM